MIQWRTAETGTAATRLWGCALAGSSSLQPGNTSGRGQERGFSPRWGRTRENTRCPEGVENPCNSRADGEDVLLWLRKTSWDFEATRAILRAARVADAAGVGRCASCRSFVAIDGLRSSQSYAREPSYPTCNRAGDPEPLSTTSATGGGRYKTMDNPLRGGSRNVKRKETGSLSGAGRTWPVVWLCTGGRVASGTQRLGCLERAAL